MLTGECDYLAYLFCGKLRLRPFAGQISKEVFNNLQEFLCELPASLQNRSGAAQGPDK